ncbi:MAG: hypothetical protein NC095_01540 [Muribaculum sp.]|nr:hypothetical protein [Muribaculum sp.]
MSNCKGLVQYEIGSADEFAFAAIDWSADLKLQVSVDLNGGTDYTSVYDSTISAVPYCGGGERRLPSRCTSLLR